MFSLTDLISLCVNYQKQKRTACLYTEEVSLLPFFHSIFCLIPTVMPECKGDSLGLNSRRNFMQAISRRSTCRARSLVASSWPLWTRLDRVTSAWDKMDDSSTCTTQATGYFRRHLKPSQVKHFKFHPRLSLCERLEHGCDVFFPSVF